MKIDHFAVSGMKLEEATEYVESTLGYKMEKGGKHKLFGTHNNLLGLKDGLYIEAIAVDPAVKNLNFSRWFNLDNFYGDPKLTNWICNCENIDQCILDFDVDVGDILKIKRDKLNWKMTVKNDGLLPFNNIFPAIIEWGYKTIHPTKSLPQVDCELFHLSIYHPLVEDLRFNLKNLNDKRISFIKNNEKGIVAEFKTKKGNKILSSF